MALLGRPTPVRCGRHCRPGNGRTYKVTTAGVSDTTEPTWPTTSGGTVSDGTVTWTEFSAVDVAITPTDAFFERYATAMTDCLAAAGISVNFEFASVDGDGCWQDPATKAIGSPRMDICRPSTMCITTVASIHRRKWRAIQPEYAGIRLSASPLAA